MLAQATKVKNEEQGRLIEQAREVRSHSGTPGCVCVCMCVREAEDACACVYDALCQKPCTCEMDL